MSKSLRALNYSTLCRGCRLFLGVDKRCSKPCRRHDTKIWHWCSCSLQCSSNRDGPQGVTTIGCWRHLGSGCLGCDHLPDVQGLHLSTFLLHICVFFWRLLSACWWSWQVGRMMRQLLHKLAPYPICRI